MISLFVLTPIFFAALKLLSKANGRLMKEFLREGIDLILTKYKIKRKT